MEVLIFNRPVPSDKRLPAFYSPCGRIPAQTGDGSVIDKGHVLEMLAYDLSVPQVNDGDGRGCYKALIYDIQVVKDTLKVAEKFIEK